MIYNPNIHHRRSIRLKGYDYSKAGLYFITICCEDRICRFGEIVGPGFNPAHDGIRQPQGFVPTMQLNEYGQIAYNEWAKLPERFTNFELDVFQIMPNHVHGIISLNDVGATLAVAPNDTNAQTGQPHTANKGQPQGLPLPTIGDIVGAYKSLVANECLKIFKTKNETMGKMWQRDYYEHIIRDEQSYQRISEYIINNPAKWKDDKFHKS